MRALLGAQLTLTSGNPTRNNTYTLLGVSLLYFGGYFLVFNSESFYVAQVALELRDPLLLGCITTPGTPLFLWPGVTSLLSLAP